ncbi:transcriptional regulator [Microlunatus endophyticus]|uniref:Transcriptional regulator n=1 Tax=Microlunatus endophyticus TaxID=1716077 RepID=A0A917SFD8_9ACTN|nr:helix-turn-helix domain-containing protein [Microlunatus endophyticus]GGL73221.1 transcriptional regulator [Microlunatus endophyticus]
MDSANPLLRNVTGRTAERRRAAVDEPGLEEIIGRNVRELRTTAGLTVAEMADRIGISKAMLSKIENANTSASLSTLSLLATGLDVPVTSLFRGADAEREAVYTPRGTGPRIARNGTRVGHEYESLGSLRGRHKRLESLLVTLTENSETYPVFQHPGTEFLYMLEGIMVYGHSRQTYRLTPGDSLILDGEGAHGPTELVELPISFLSIIAFPDSMV